MPTPTLTPVEQPGFIEQLVEWRDFEQFVRDLFGADPNLVAEHDFIEVGKSGARRQIDVKLTHRVGGMTYVTVIECKRWKERIDRTRIDILAATIRDLNAAKGVMFTTSGFEEGAELYAATRDRLVRRPRSHRCRVGTSRPWQPDTGRTARTLTPRPRLASRFWRSASSLPSCWPFSKLRSNGGAGRPPGGMTRSYCSR